MSELKIYSPNNTLITATPDFIYSGAAMGEKNITCTLSSPVALEVKPKCYVTFRGEKYFMRDDATVKRIAKTNWSGEALQYSCVFKSKQTDLVDCDFLDYVLNNDMYYTGMGSFSFWGDVYDLARRIQACLDQEFTGSNKWTILMPCTGFDTPQPVASIARTARSLNSETKQISPSDENCWNALTRANSDFGFFFYLDTSRQEIFIGVPYPEFKVDGQLIAFEYGKGKGAYEIQRDVEAGTIVTRLRVRGSNRNIPRDYLRSEAYPRFTQNLQLPVFRETVAQARPTDYLLADQSLIDYFGIRPGTKTFDDIFPSIEGMVDANGHAIDTIHAIEALDDTINPDGSLVQSYFYVYLYDMGFDLNDFLTAEDATLSMKTGYCVTDFKIVEAKALTATDPYYSEGCRWKYRLEKDVTSSANYVLPSGNVKPKLGDKFVLLYILMPESYILQTEERLEGAAQKYLDENSKSKISYTISLDEIYFANRPVVADALKEGVSLIIKDNELGDTIAEDGSRYTLKSVQNLTITYRKEQSIPSYQMTMADQVKANPINRIENEVSDVKENTVNQGTQNTVNRRNGVRNSRNLTALRNLVFDTDGYFDPDNIRPNSIETLYLAVGAKSQDFTTNMINLKAFKDDEGYKINISTGYINHRALWWGGGSEAPSDINRFTWGVNTELTQLLPEDATPYYVYAKAERATQLAMWYVSDEKLNFDYDTNHYYLLMGVVYPVEGNRRDIALTNGRAYIAGGSIYGDVIRSINYVEDDSNEGSKYDLNSGSIRIGNTLKGLVFDTVNRVFKFFGIDLEIRNTSDEIVAKIDGNDGSAMFAKGNAMFGATGDVNVTGTIQSNNDEGYKIKLDPVDRSLKLITQLDLIVASLKQYSNGADDYGAVLDMQNNGNSHARFTPYDMQYYDTASNKAFKFTLLSGVGGYPRGMFLGDSRDGNLSEGSNYPYFLVDPYTSNGKLKIILKDLPTNAQGLDNYQLWLNNGKLDIYITEESN